MPAEARPVPGVPGILSAADVSETAAAIAAVQEPSGAIPWTTGEHTDLWNHVEGAMALLVGGQVDAAERAFEWAVTVQRHDGSFPLKIVEGTVEDASGDANASAYLAVGLWHDWLVRRDRGVVRRLWSAVRRGLDFVVGLQLPFGGIAWSQEWHDGRPGSVNADALLAGSSSIHGSLHAGLALAELMGEPQPEWELAAARLGHAIRRHRDQFLDKSCWSMDWYYPVLGGALRGQAGQQQIGSQWTRFVRPGLGILCIDHNRWVTGAETCELVMALDALGDHGRALRLFADMQHLRDTGGRYWTGYVYPDEVNWPVEHTTYTAAAVILAADAVAAHSGSGATGGSGIMRGHGLRPRELPELGLECGCEPGREAGVASGQGSADLAAGAAQDPQGADHVLVDEVAGGQRP